MAWIATLYWWLLLFSAVGASVCVVVSWRRLDDPWLPLVFADTAIWSACSVLFASIDSDADAQVLYCIRMSAVALLMPTTLTFVLGLTGRNQWQSGWRLAAIFAIPTITVTLLWVRFEWLYEELLFGMYQGLRVVADHEFAPWFYVHLGTSYLGIAAAIGLLFNWITHSLSKYRPQLFVLAVLCTAHLLANVPASFAKAMGLPILDWTGATFVLPGPMWMWFIFRFSRSALQSVARDALLSQMTDIVVVLDEHGQVVDANGSYGELEAAGAGDTVERLLAGHDRVSGGRWEVALDVGGERRHLDVEATPLSGRGGRGVLLVSRDVTEKAALLEELESYDRMVAHDLRRPLVGVVSRLDLVKRRAEHAQTTLDPGIAEARASGTTALAIVDVHLRLAGARRFDKLARERVDMNLIVASALGRLHEEIERGGAVVVTSHDLPAAVGDKHLVEEIWMNYLSNALTHSGRQPRIEIGAHAESSAQVRYWVRDSGIGLTADERESLLAQPGTIVSEGGHGLGLVIVRRSVERLGGRMGIDANEDAGSTFWFTLPATK